MYRNRTTALILHNIRSAENVGSILRTADAVGVEWVYLCGITPAPTDRFGRPNGKVLKASLGAEDSVTWETDDDIFSLIKRLKKNGTHIIALEQSYNSVSYRNIHPKGSFALIVGAENGGIEKELLAICDEVIEIPMWGKKESLNVAVAIGIALYALSDH